MTGGWKFAAASVIGTSHLGSPSGICQDAHCCVYDIDADRLVCVVSDGAGSASRAERGSRLSCDLVCDLVLKGNAETIHTKDFALKTLEVIRTALLSEAAQENLRVREFACTLLVALVNRDRATFWQIGDGAICFRLPSEDSFSFVFWPSKGEYARLL
jgi:serine/threonine protein phosphatase PrpC